MQVQIDPEFQALIPPLSEQELSRLEENLAADGCRDPIVTWQGWLLDGHNRHVICTRLGIEYSTVEVELPDREAALDWIDANQLGRRNLTPEQMSFIRGRVYNRSKKSHGAEVGGRGNQYAEVKDQNDPLPRQSTAKKLAKEHGVSAATIKRDGKFAEEVEKSPELKKAVAENRSVKKVKKEIQKKNKQDALSAVPSDLPTASGRYQLIHSNISAAEIEDDSIDCIITDPPYPKDYLDTFSALSHCAGRWLKPGGSMLVMSGQSWLPDVLARLQESESLTYQWTLAYLTPGGQSVQIWPRKVNTFWKPVLWFVKGEYNGYWMGDVANSKANDKRFHDWGQSESGMKSLIEKVSLPGQTILDPFCGGGTTGVVSLQMDRFFIGIDSDKESISKTANRLEGIPDAKLVE